jgi:hypothetical protein
MEDIKTAPSHSEAQVKGSELWKDPQEPLQPITQGKCPI